MLNFVDGLPIAIVKNKNSRRPVNKMLFLDENDDTGMHQVHLPESQIFSPLANEKTRDVVYVCAPSGAGKSTYAADYLRAFNTLFKNAPIYAFSRVSIYDDPAYTDIKNIIEVPIDENLLANPIDILADIDDEYCCILFDDVNTVNDKDLKDALFKIIYDVLECGRKKNIYSVITSHLIIPSDKKFARCILNECTSLTVFPKCSVQQIRYALKTYIGLPSKDIDFWLKQDSRWLTFSKTYPHYVLGQNICKVT